VFAIVDGSEFVLLDLKHKYLPRTIFVRRPALLPASGPRCGRWERRSVLRHLADARAATLPKEQSGRKFDQVLRLFDDSDPALEWCENRLLERESTPAITHPEQSARVMNYSETLQSRKLAPSLLCSSADALGPGR